MIHVGFKKKNVLFILGLCITMGIVWFSPIIISHLFSTSARGNIMHLIGQTRVGILDLRTMKKDYLYNWEDKNWRLILLSAGKNQDTFWTITRIKKQIEIVEHGMQGDIRFKKIFPSGFLWSDQTSRLLYPQNNTFVRLSGDKIISYNLSIKSEFDISSQLPTTKSNYDYLQIYKIGDHNCLVESKKFNPPESHDLFVVDILNGNVLFSKSFSDILSLKSISKNRILLNDSTNKRMFIIDVSTGNEISSFPSTSWTYGVFGINEDLFYWGEDDNQLYQYDILCKSASPIYKMPSGWSVHDLIPIDESTLLLSFEDLDSILGTKCKSVLLNYKTKTVKKVPYMTHPIHVGNFLLWEE